MLKDTPKQKDTTRVETILPPKSWRLTKAEQAILEYAREYVTNKVGYQVTLYVYMIDRFPDGGQCGSCNYETQSGKVFALDIYMSPQKTGERLITLLHELGHVMDYYTISEDEPELAKEFCDVEEFGIDKAVGIGFEAEKRAWYWAHILMIGAGIATPKLTRQLFKDKYESLEASIEDLYVTLKKERRKKKGTKDAKGTADNGSTDTGTDAGTDSGTGGQEEQPAKGPEEREIISTPNFDTSVWPSFNRDEGV